MTRICIFIIGLFFFSSCAKEEIVLTENDLYSEELIEEFTIFDPCDTIKGPDYILTKNTQSGVDVANLFHLRTPENEVLFFGRSLEESTDFEKTELYYRGMNIRMNNEDDLFLLFENEFSTGVENIYIFAKNVDFTGDLLILTSTNMLAGALFGDGELFKVNIYEASNSGSSITFGESVRVTATSGNGSAINYAFNNASLPRSFEQTVLTVIDDMLTDGSLVNTQAKTFKFDLQLGLHQRDFGFAKGLLNSDQVSPFSSGTKRTFGIIERIKDQKMISAFFCLSDAKEWQEESTVGNHMISPFN